MNILLRLLWIVHSLFFSSLAQSYTITSSSEQKEIEYPSYKVEYSTNNHLISRYTSRDREKFLVKGAFLNFTYKERNAKTFTVEVLSIGNSSVYRYQPGGQIPIKRLYVGDTFDINFFHNGDSSKKKTVFFLMRSKHAEQLRIKVNNIDELSINFVKANRSNYCRISVIDSRGGISFSDYKNTNNATFIYDTASVQNLSFESKISGKDHRGNRLSNPIKKELKDNLEYYYIENKSSTNSINARDKDLSHNHKFFVNERYQINNSGVITMSPFISLNKSQLKSARYQIKTTVTCQP